MLKRTVLVSAWIFTLSGCGGGGGESSTDNDQSPSGPTQPINTAPSISAFDDIVADENTNVTITAEATDPEGDALSYLWTQKSGHDVELNDPESRSVSFVAPEVYPLGDPEVIELTVKVTDTGNISTSAAVSISINPVNKGPSLESVTAGLSNPRGFIPADEIQAFEHSEVSLHGLVRPDHADVTEVSWKQIGGRTALLEGFVFASELPIASGQYFDWAAKAYLPEVDSAGDILEFELLATDSDGKQTSKTVKITVKNINRGNGTLNDTGIVDCIGGDYWTTECSSLPTNYSDQDAQHGLDALYPDDSDGKGGFSFTKLDEYGNALPSNATDWSCVRDERTGLTWEAKKQNQGLHYYDAWYKWRNFDFGINGSFYTNASYSSYYSSSCEGSECFTDSFVEAVNAEELCGLTDWRLPEIYEAISLIDFQNIPPHVDSNYFPQANWGISPPHGSICYRRSCYWSGTPRAAEDARSAIWVYEFGLASTTYSHSQNGEVGQIILVSGSN